jgi:hypothetical protein
MSTEQQNSEVKATFESIFATEVVKRVRMNNHTSWAGADSLHVIEALCDHAYLDTQEGFSIKLRSLVGDLMNASAFRQKLEKLPTSNPAHVVPTGNKRGTPSGALATLAGLK